MIYPASLQPTTTETLTLTCGRLVAFPKATPTFTKWQGKPIDDDYGGKQILDLNGRPAFAELVILGTLQSERWHGVWVDKSVFQTSYWPKESPSQKPSSISQEIWNLAKTPPGVWDVFCWRGDRVLFCESKKAGRDSIRESQLLFAESALNLGVPRDSFLFVEWTTD